MKKKLLFKMAVKYAITILIFGIAGFTVLVSCSSAAKKAEVTASSQQGVTMNRSTNGDSGAGSKVYMTTDISSAGLMAVYEALGRKATGKVAVKIPTGEPTNRNHLSPTLIKDLVQSVNGTFVESNVAYGGPRASAAMHRQVAKDKGYNDIAPLDILDEEGSIGIPFAQGKNITEDFVGSHFGNYDFYVVLTHFKGHQMAGFGGAIKNISIGIASPEGKLWIHTGGVSKTDFPLSFRTDQNIFLESMAEAAGAVMNHLGDNILYINVMNRISIDCDCNGEPAEPDIHDIGILASLDPVALDKACIDLIYAAEGAQSLIARIESQNGIHTIDHAAALGLGNLTYELVKL